MGAIVAYFLIFKGFGLASLLFMPLFFIYGVKIVFQKELYPARKLLNYVVFFAFWLSTTFGFLILIMEQEEAIGFVAGGIGYELATICNEIIGLGTLLLIILSFLVFIIFAFNITTFASGSKENLKDEEDKDNDVSEDESEEEEIIEESDG